MRKLAMVSVFLLGTAPFAFSQQAYTAPERADLWSSPLLGAANSSGVSSGTFPSFSARHSSPVELAEADASPAARPEPPPRFVFGSSQDFRWQVAVGYEYVHFRSSAFDLNLHGLNTSLAYFTNEWFAIEGNVISAWGAKLFADETSKYALFTGGPKIAWRGKKLEPWGHALFGGLHVNPQIAGGFSQTSFAFQIGGGVDYRFAPSVAIRAEGDYVRSHLYSASQNNFQVGVGVAFSF